MQQLVTSATYSVVIPVYNSTQSVIELCDRLVAVFEGLRERFEIILVDDASPNQETWPALVSLSNRDSRIRSIQLMMRPLRRCITMTTITMTVIRISWEMASLSVPSVSDINPDRS